MFSKYDQNHTLALFFWRTLVCNFRPKKNFSNTNLHFMRTLSIFFLMLSFVFFSCSDDDTPAAPSDDFANLSLVTTLENSTHRIGLYTASGQLQTGHNPIYLNLVDKASNQRVTNAQMSWLPVMQMTMMSHSCPFSSLELAPHKQALYLGSIVFQMATMGSDVWTLAVNYQIDGQSFSAESAIEVMPESHRRVQVFTGADNEKYVLAMVAPESPITGTNQMRASLHRAVTGMSYELVDDYTILIDPRMPTMNNHGSPGNIALQQSQSQGDYIGALTLTMTGYWRINLQVLNAENTAVYGTTVTDEQPTSPLYFDLSF